jgi:hypothetical protein
MAGWLFGIGIDALWHGMVGPHRKDDSKRRAWHVETESFLELLNRLDLERKLPFWDSTVRPMWPKVNTRPQYPLSWRLLRLKNKKSPSGRGQT